MPSEVLRIHECVLFKNEEEEEEDAAPFAVLCKRHNSERMWLFLIYEIATQYNRESGTIDIDKVSMKRLETLPCLNTE